MEVNHGTSRDGGTMISRARLISHLLILIVLAVVTPIHAQGTVSPPIKYTIQQGDTLWLIATQYYNAPGAYRSVYDYNRRVLDRVNKSPHKGPDQIFPGTNIELPSTIMAGGIPYKRRDTPMNRALAEKIASPQGIDVNGLLKITIDELFPKFETPPAAPPPPFDHHSPLSKAPNAKRESMPEWFKTPGSGLERCAKDVCRRFAQLCYFECMSVAKRVNDGDALEICGKLQKNPFDQSVTLPYEVDEDTREKCAELVE